MNPDVTRRDQLEKLKRQAKKGDPAEPLWQIALLLAELADAKDASATTRKA